jgi:hypothetical protein
MHIKLYGTMFPYNKYIKQMHIIQYMTMTVMNCFSLNAILGWYIDCNNMHGMSNVNVSLHTTCTCH